MLKHLVWIAVVLLAAACDDPVDRRSTPTGPSEPAAPGGPAAPAGSYSIWIVSGADGSPVRGATVVIEGRTYQSDDQGKVTDAAPPGTWALDVDAAGFLPRRTTTGVTRTIALWPVASQAEAEAVRSMVYQRGGRDDGVLMPAQSGPFYLTFDTSHASIPGAIGAWGKEAIALGSMFGMTYELLTSFQYETNEVHVRFGEGVGGACSPVAAWGFCRDSLNYKIFKVVTGKAVDTPTIRRVLVSWFLGPNPLPGLMNLEAPADTLSPLEMQTIRMVLQRPLKNRWPDDDRW